MKNIKKKSLAAIFILFSSIGLKGQISEVALTTIHYAIASSEYLHYFDSFLDSNGFVKMGSSSFRSYKGSDDFNCMPELTIKPVKFEGVEMEDRFFYEVRINHYIRICGCERYETFCMDCTFYNDKIKYLLISLYKNSGYSLLFLSGDVPLNYSSRFFKIDKIGDLNNYFRIRLYSYKLENLNIDLKSDGTVIIEGYSLFYLREYKFSSSIKNPDVVKVLKELPLKRLGR